MKPIPKGALAQLAQRGGEISVRVVAGAGRDQIVQDGDTLRIQVTAIAEGGRANKAVTRLLARALGVAPSQLVLVRGATSRNKVFRLHEQE